ncbi:MAG: hypothetical protein H7840_03340 [Alphaproteobacteria bacterium]
MALKIWKGSGLSRIRRWLGIGRESRTAPEKTEDDANKWYDGSEVQTLGLDQVLRQEATDGVNKVYTVTLDDFQTAVGSKWSRLKVKVDLIADGVVKRHIGRNSLCTVEGGDGTYMVMMLDSNSVEGRRRVVNVANDLGHRLVGTRFGAKGAKMRIFECDPRQFHTLDGTIDEAALARIAATGREITAREAEGLLPPEEAAEHRPARPAAGPVPSDRPPSGQNVKQPAAEGRVGAPSPAAEAARAQRRPIPPPTPAERHPETSVKLVDVGRVPDPAPDAPGTFRPTGQTTVDVGTSGARQSGERDPGRSVSRREADPNWLGGETTDRTVPEVGRSGERREVDPNWVATSAPGRSSGPGTMVPIDHSPGGKVPGSWVAMGAAGKPEPPPPAAAEPDAPPTRLVYRPAWSAATQAIDVFCCLPAAPSFRLSDDKARLLFDIGMASGVATSLRDAPLPWPYGTAIVPVHYASLLGRGAQRLLDRLATCAEALGRRHFRIEVIDILPTATTERVGQVVEMLRPHCHGVLLRTTLAAPRLEMLKTWAPAAIGADIGTLPEAERAKGPFVAALTRFRSSAGDTPAYIWGARRPQEVLTVVEAGFSMVNGPVMIPDQPTPVVPMALTRAAIVAQTAGAGTW